ncbi:hypothetical protein [uncultured Helicobacter sp.]|uniref:hypothetical protein n=1 Tax=uncultured Helicobacter sp. TaxID=175537 RepID=UPI00374FE113
MIEFFATTPAGVFIVGLIILAVMIFAEFASFAPDVIDIPHFLIMILAGMINILWQPRIFDVLVQNNILLLATLWTLMLLYCVFFLLRPLMQYEQGLIALSFANRLVMGLGIAGILLGIISGITIGLGMI